MKSNRTKIRIGATIAVLSLLFVIGAVSRQTVQAQDRNDVYGQDSTTATAIRIDAAETGTTTVTMAALSTFARRL